MNTADPTPQSAAIQMIPLPSATAEPWTSDRLVELALAQEAEYHRLLKLHPPGTFHEGRNYAHERCEQALACAGWMQAQDIEKLRWVGPFGIVNFRRGMPAMLARGARVFGTGSRIPREGKLLLRQTTVTVHSIDQGYVNTSTGKVTQPRVNWAGTGGYWRWTDLNNTAD